MDTAGRLPGTEPWAVAYATPFKDWLTANGIDVDYTPPWPQLTVDVGAGLIRIEQWWFDDTPAGDGAAVGPVVIHDDWARVMREFPLAEPMGVDLAAAWELMAERGRRAEAIREFAREMRGNRITAMTVSQGDQLLLVIPGATPVIEQAFTASVRELLPGVQVRIAVGVSAVVAIEHTKGEPSGVEVLGTELTVRNRKPETRGMTV